jgi:transcriptional regulator with XRE-family HTH domain
MVMSEEDDRIERQPYTPEWAARVIVALEGPPRITRTALAERVGCSKGLITKILKGEHQSGRYIQRISEVLGIAPPTTPHRTPTTTLGQLVDQLSALDEKKQQTALRVLVEIFGLSEQKPE